MDFSAQPQDHAKLLYAPQTEVRKAPNKPEGIPEIDPKNPVFVLTKRVSSDVGGIIHVAEKTAVTRKAGERTAELKSEREKKEFLSRLVPTLKADSPIKQAIEKRTLQIHEVPGRDLFALSLDGRDVDMIFEKSGKERYDFHWSRADMMRYAALH